MSVKETSSVPSNGQDNQQTEGTIKTRNGMGVSPHFPSRDSLGDEDDEEEQ